MKKPRIILYVLGGVFAVVVLGVGVAVYFQSQKASELRDRLNREERQLRAEYNKDIFPSQANVETIQKNFSAVQGFSKALRDELRKGMVQPERAKTPGDFSRLREEMIAQLIADAPSGIGDQKVVKDDVQFGFGRYATGIPAEKDDEGSGASDKKEFKYYVGEADGAYYARLKNSRIIYNITEEAYSAVADASYESLEPDEVILLDWDTVDSIEAEIDGSVYTVEMEKDDDDGYSYTVDGVAAAFDNVIDAIDGLTIASDESDESESAGGEEEDTIKVPEEKPDADGRDVELKLTFHRNTEENSKIELTFYRYNGSWCVSSLNGEYVNYTDRESVVDLKEAINSAILNVK